MGEKAETEAPNSHNSSVGQKKGEQRPAGPLSSSYQKQVKVQNQVLEFKFVLSALLFRVLLMSKSLPPYTDS